METLSHAFFARAAETPAAPALICEGETFSYAALAGDAGRLSNALAANGVAPGDAIGVLLPNSADFVLAMLAAADLGAVLVPLSPALPDAAVARTFEAGDVRHVIAAPARIAALQAAGVSAGLWCASLRRLIETAPMDAAPLALGAPDAPYILSATSGSTGDPKAIVLTQRGKLARARAAIALYGVTPRDRILAATPLYHSLAERLVLMALISGACALVMARYTPAAWLERVAEDRASFAIAVSSQLAQIARHLRANGAGRRYESLRCIVSSSAPLSAEDKALIRASLRAEFHECYGASEIAIASSLNLSTGDAPLASVGRAAAGVEIRILDENGRPLAPGAVGEIACRTPMAFAGYHKRPDLTAAALADGFFRTGDLGRLTANGVLYYLGRTKDLIITGGINVYPADVEAVVLSLAGVQECAAFPLADERLGEIVALAAVKGPGAAVSARDIRAACALALADYQQPQRIVFLEALPRNAMGKLMRKQLPAAVAALAEQAAA